MPASGLKYQSSSMPTRQRPGRAVQPAGGAKMKARAALGLQADRPRAGERADRVGPGAGGIDHHRRLGARPPACTCHTPPLARERRHLGVAARCCRRRAGCRAGSPGGWRARPCRTASGSSTAPITCSRRSTGTSAQRLGARRAGGRAARSARSTSQCACSSASWPWRATISAPRGASSGCSAKPSGGASKKARLAHRQRAHLRRAVAFHEERGRAAGGVVAGLRLPLQQQHAAVRGEQVADRGAGDAGADDDEVGGSGHPSMLEQVLRIRKIFWTSPPAGHEFACAPDLRSRKIVRHAQEPPAHPRCIEPRRGA